MRGKDGNGNYKLMNSGGWQVNGELRKMNGYSEKKVIFQGKQFSFGNNVTKNGSRMPDGQKMSLRLDGL
ncbi:MAG: hypothetical protein Kow0089_19030 [Desulfobulbaceae bacterium]